MRVWLERSENLFGIKNGTFSLISLETGEKLLDSIEVINTSIETTNGLKDYRMGWMPNVTMSMESCEFSPDALEKLFGNDQKTYNIEANGTRPVMVQARKHKAKRINKKWLKRYGYREIQVPIHMKLDDCTITSNEFGENCFCVEGKVNEMI